MSVRAYIYIKRADVFVELTGRGPDEHTMARAEAVMCGVSWTCGGESGTRTKSKVFVCVDGQHVWSMVEN